MKKSIFAMTLISSIMIITTGCGGGDDDTNPQDITLDFTKTDTSYDLSEYFAPDSNQTHNYIDRTYTNDNGEKKYDDLPDDESFSATTFEVNGATVLEYDGTDLDTTYNILTDKIQSIDADDSSFNMEIVRFANKDDYITKLITTRTDESLNYNVEQVCKISSQITSKEVNDNTYTDVIEIKCTGISTASATLNNKAYTYKSDSTETTYLAKGIGLISSTGEYCSTTTLGTIDSKECEKDVTEITTIGN